MDAGNGEEVVEVDGLGSDEEREWSTVDLGMARGFLVDMFRGQEEVEEARVGD